MQPGRRQADGRAVAVDERRRLQDAVHCQRHDDRRDAETDNANTVDEADRGSAASTVGAAQSIAPSAPQLMPVNRTPAKVIIQGIDRSRPPHKITTPWPRTMHRGERCKHKKRVEISRKGQLPAQCQSGHNQHNHQSRVGGQHEAQCFAVADEPSPPRAGRQLVVAARRSGRDDDLSEPRPARVETGADPLPAGCERPEMSPHRRVAAERGAQHRQHQEHALGRGAKEGGDVNDQKHINREHQREGTEYRPEAAAAPAMQRRAAEHHGHENRQQHRRSDQRVGGARLRG